MLTVAAFDSCKGKDSRKSIKGLLRLTCSFVYLSFESSLSSKKGGVPLAGKIFDRIVKTIFFLVLFWLLSFIIIGLVMDYLEDYEVFHSKDTPAVVTKKVAVNNLTGKPKYFVIVDLNEHDTNNGIKNRVFAWQFKRLEVGDTIKGYHIREEHFFTGLDILADSVIFVFGLLIMLFFWLMLILWPISKFLESREKRRKPQSSQKQKKSEPKKKKRRKVIKPFLKRILSERAYQFLEDFLFDKVIFIIFFSIVLVLTSGFTMNGLQKNSPIGKTKTTADVTDHHAKSEAYYYIGEVSDPYYTLDLIFEDKQGQEYRVIKEVTQSTYQHHKNGRPIEISYVNFNPYNVFVRDYRLWNLMEITRYVKFIFFSMTLIVMAIITLLYVHFKRKKKKKG